jgi:hypothetical protein
MTKVLYLIDAMKVHLKAMWTVFYRDRNFLRKTYS